MTVHHVSLGDCLEGVFPPGKVLTIGVVNDTAFVYINGVTQGDAKSETQTVHAEIAVSLPSLCEALTLLGNDRAREALRPDVPAGGRETRLGGQRSTVVPA